MSIGRKLLRSSFVRTSRIFLQVIVALIMTPVIVHSLGDRMYGFWVLIGTFIGYYGLLDLGLSSAVARFLSRAEGLNDADEANRVINTALAIFSLVGVAVLVLSGVAALSCGHFIHDPGEAALFRKIILLLGVSVAVGFPTRVFGGVLDAHLRHDLPTYASVIRLLAANACIWFLLRSGHGILALAVVSFIGGMAEYFMLYIFARRVAPEMKIRMRQYARETAGRMFGYSSKTFVAQLADILRFRVDSLVIAGFLTVSLVTHYSVGARLADYFSQIMVGAMGILAPVFSRYEGQSDFEAIRRNFLHATKFSVILSVFIGTGIIFYGRPFIQRWMGPGFDSSYIVAVILTVSFTVELMQTPGVGLLYGISKHHYYAIANVSEGILNLILSLILVRYYGIYGVALATMIVMLLFKLFIQPVYICKSIGMPVTEYYWKTIAPATIKSALPLSLFYYITHNMIKAEYSSIITFGLIETALFVPIAYYLVLGRQERQLIINTIAPGSKMSCSRT